MTETSLPWGGVAVGDAGPYNDDIFGDMLRDMLISDNTKQGVVLGNAGELHVTNPAGMTIRVASGAGMVDGKFYRNTADIDFTVVTPGGGNNYYTVVLRKGWVTQQVRAAIVGPSAVAYPSPTQVNGANWEIPLAYVQVTSGGAVTVTDKREFCQYASADGVKLQSIISTGTPDEFVFSNIPQAYHYLKIKGVLKYTFTLGSYPAATLIGTCNGDGAAHYASVNNSNGQWSGYNSNLGLMLGSVIGSWTGTHSGGDYDDEAYNVTPIDIDILHYNNPALYKQVFANEKFFNYFWSSPNPTNGWQTILNVWYQLAPITSIEIVGTFVAGISKLDLYGAM